MEISWRRKDIQTDGTYTSIHNPNSGTWKITKGELDIILGESVFHFFLPLDPHGTRGVDGSGRPQTLSRADSKPAPEDHEADGEAPSPTPRISPEVQQSASSIIQKYHNSLVFVTGKEGAGSGFIGTMGGNNYLFTNVHVTAEIRDAAFKTLDGADVQGGVPSMAVGEDIFCMAMPSGAPRSRS